MTSDFGSDSLPDLIPLFPLSGTLLLPRATLPLNIFEPRYLAMVRDAMAGDRLIGIIQPRGAAEPQPALYQIGGVGRITQFAETGDGRFLISLTGLQRFRVRREVEADKPYRLASVDYDGFAADWREPDPLPALLRADLENSLRVYLDGQDLSADWQAVGAADDESLVHTLATACPFETAEKQALIEAADLRERTVTLSALMAFAPGSAVPAGGTMH